MDISGLLEPVAEDAPSGAELRNDARFHAIERLIEPAAREFRINSDGSVNESAPDVDWQQVLDDAVALAGDGRDLRVLVVVVRGLANLEGFAGLTRGMTMLDATVREYWDSLHPALRDRDDAKMAALPRINALKQLENDDNGLLGDLKFNTVLNPRGIGPVTGADLAAGTLSDFEVLNQAASGLGQAEKDALVAAHGQRVNRVTAATRALAAEEATRAAGLIGDLQAAEAAIAALCAGVAEKGGFGSDPGLTLPELSEHLELMRRTLEAGVADSGEGAAPDAEDAAATTGATAAAPASAARPAPATGGDSVPGQINSRGDVERALDQIIAFYERTEPSSPIPHIARRMRRMVPMDFVELMEEIAPSGMKEFRNIAGVDEPKKK